MFLPKCNVRFFGDNSWIPFEFQHPIVWWNDLICTFSDVRHQVLPVMIMGAFIPGLRRKYAVHEYIAALLLVVGLILFTLADAQTSPNFSVMGVVMVSGALIMDSFLGNFQEAIFTTNPETSQVTNYHVHSIILCLLNLEKFSCQKLDYVGLTQMEMLFCSTVVGLPFLIPPMLLTGELFKAWNSCKEVILLTLFVPVLNQVFLKQYIVLWCEFNLAPITTNYLIDLCIA